MKNDFVVYAAALVFLLSGFRFTWHSRQKGSYTGELSERIKRIAYINEQISQCDDLLLEIHITEPQALKNIPVSWKTAAGIDHRADIYISGSGGEVTKKMKALIKARRAELVASLFRELSKLPGTSGREGYENDGGKYEKSRGEGARK